LALRKIALLLKPDKEINHRGNHMTVKTLSTFRNYVLEFEVGVEFEEDLGIVDGRKCQVTCSGLWGGAGGSLNRLGLNKVASLSQREAGVSG